MTGPAFDAALDADAAFDAETAAAEVMAAMLPLADAELSKKEPAYVAAWTQLHLHLMSGVTFREAVRRLPTEQAAPLRALYPTRARR